MNYKFFFAILILVLLTSFTNAQVYLSAKIGYGGYTNSDLKSFLKDMKSDLEVDATITDNFPGHYYPEFEVLYQINEEVIVGLVATYYSTGGRIYYEDYSGKIQTDFTLNGWGIGGYGELILNDFNIGTISLYGKVLIEPNNSELDFRTNIGNESDYETIAFQSINIGIQPGINSRIFLGPAFVEASVGFEHNIAGELVLKDDPEYHLQDENGDEVNINWDGFRVSLGIGVTF